MDVPFWLFVLAKSFGITVILVAFWYAYFRIIRWFWLG